MVNSDSRTMLVLRDFQVETAQKVKCSVCQLCEKKIWDVNTKGR